MSNLNDMISSYFEEAGYVWKLKGGDEILPSPTDIQKVLDKAASVLYSEDTGSNVRVGSLLVEKTETGFDVYILAGSYQ